MSSEGDIFMGIGRLGAKEDAVPPPPPASPDNNLERLFITTGRNNVALDPMFQPDLTSFKATVINDIEFVIVTPFVNHPLASAVVKLKDDVAEQVTDEYLTEQLRPPPRPKPEVQVSVGPNGEPIVEVHVAGGAEAKIIADGTGEEQVFVEVDGSSSQVGSNAGGADENVPANELGDEVENDHEPSLVDGEDETELLKPKVVVVEEPEPEPEFVVPTSYRVPLIVGKNPVYVVVTAENGETRTTAIRVIRKEWDPYDWEKKNADSLAAAADGSTTGTAEEGANKVSPEVANENKFKWYKFGAENNDARAQYHLALMYAGEDGWGLDLEEGQEGGFDGLDDDDVDGVVRRLEKRWVKMDDERAMQLHLKWLLRSGNNGYIPATKRLANVFFEEEIQRDWIEHNPEINREIVISKLTDEERALPADEQPEIDLDVENMNFKQEAGFWYKKSADQGDKESALALAHMYMKGIGFITSFRKAVYWLERSGVQIDDAEDQVFDHYKVRAEQGDGKAAFQLARMYIDGIGTAMDFDTAKFWFGRSGRSEEYSRQQIDKKCNTLKPMYRELFNSHDIDADGQIDKNEFMGFYRDCLMAKGYSRKKADEETVSPYQGTIKSDNAFKAYDINKDYKISFDEIWALREKVSTLIPKTEKHYDCSVRFFGKWKEDLRRAESTQAMEQDLKRDALLRANTEFMLYTQDIESDFMRPDPNAKKMNGTLSRSATMASLGRSRKDLSQAVETGSSSRRSASRNADRTTSRSRSVRSKKSKKSSKKSSASGRSRSKGAKKPLSRAKSAYVTPGEHETPFDEDELLEDFEMLSATGSIRKKRDPQNLLVNPTSLFPSRRNLRLSVASSEELYAAVDEFGAAVDSQEEDGYDYE